LSPSKLYTVIVGGGSVLTVVVTKEVQLVPNVEKDVKLVKRTTNPPLLYVDVVNAEVVGTWPVKQDVVKTIEVTAVGT
jgi:hypothetical protein